LLITAADDALVHVFLVSSLLAPDAQMKLDLNSKSISREKEKERIIDNNMVD
jgi:hypothetical protein